MSAAQKSLNICNLWLIVILNWVISGDDWWEKQLFHLVFSKNCPTCTHLRHVSLNHIHHIPPSTLKCYKNINQFYEMQCFEGNFLDMKDFASLKAIVQFILWTLKASVHWILLRSANYVFASILNNCCERRSRSYIKMKNCLTMIHSCTELMVSWPPSLTLWCEVVLTIGQWPVLFM